jgi:hypothetical protein
MHQSEIAGQLQLPNCPIQRHDHTLNFSSDAIPFPAFGQVRVCSAAQEKVNMMFLFSYAN